MMIQCIKSEVSDRKLDDFNINNNYIVLRIDFKGDEKNFQIISDLDQTPFIISSKYFKIIDHRIPPNWILKVLNDDFYELIPQEFEHGFEYSFWEDYHDCHREAEATFAKVYRDLQIFHGIEPDPIKERPIEAADLFNWRKINWRQK